jgi:hypothetical protein
MVGLDDTPTIKRPPTPAQLRQEARPRRPLADFLRETANADYAAVKDAEAARVQQWVTLIRRWRGATIADQTGFFYKGRWRDVDAEGVYTLNVVKPQVRGNTAAMVQAAIKIQIAPAVDQSPWRVAAQIAQALCDEFERLEWTEARENEIAKLAQLSAGYFLRLRYDETKMEKYAVEKSQTRVVPVPGETVCFCGRRAPVNAEEIGLAPDGQAAEGDYLPPCPACGETPMLSLEPYAADIAETVPEIATGGQLTLDTVSPFNISLDEQRATGGRLDKAHWLEHRYLEKRSAMEEKYPFAKLDKVGAWSFPLRQQRELQSGQNAVSGAVNAGDEDEWLEVREIYWQPERYPSYRLPADFQLPVNWERQIEIPAGKSLREALPDGLKFTLIGEEVVDLEPARIGDEWDCGGWEDDPFGFWWQANLALLEIQEPVNDLLTNWVNYWLRAARFQYVVREGVFDDEDFERDIMVAKANGLTDTPPDKEVGVLRPPSLNDAQAPIGFYLNEAGPLGGVQPAMVGEAAPGETFSAQLQQRQASLGLLTPSQKSKAQAKKGIFAQFLRLVQRFWPLDRLKAWRDRQGQNWTDADLRQFLTADIGRDLTAGYAQGAEIPTTLVERELKLANFLQRAQPLLALNPALLTPAATADILRQLAEYGGLAVDVNNAAAAEAASVNRWESANKLLADGATPDEILAAPELAIVAETENHLAAKEFWADKVNSFLSAPQVDAWKMAVAFGFWQAHDAALVELAQKEIAKTKQLAAQNGTASAEDAESDLMAQPSGGRDDYPAEMFSSEAVMSVGP